MSRFQQQDRYVDVRNAFGFRECAGRRRGLTLIELVIVIAILTVLGGLVVQTFPSLLKRTHLSKCSDTISALNRTWGEAYALNMRFPDRYDSLLGSNGGTGGTTLFTKLSPGLASLATPMALDPDEVKALSKIGVRNVVDMDATAADVTYDCAPLTATRRLLADGGYVAQLPVPFTTGSNDAWNANPLRLKRHLDLPATTDTVKYVVFGIGQNSTAVGAGKLLQEAPVMFVDDDTLNPSTTYQRYLAVFSISKIDGEYSAHFEAIAGDGDECPSSAEGHIREYYEGRAKDE